MKRISIHLDPQLLSWIDSESENRSEFIRKAIMREYDRIQEIEIEIIKRSIKK